MSTPSSMLDNEKNTTELTIAPDGRVFVFGTSRPILEVLAALQPHDENLQRLLEQARSVLSPSQERSEL